MPRRSRIRMVGKYEAWDQEVLADELSQLQWELRRARRQREDALHDDTDADDITSIRATKLG